MSLTTTIFRVDKFIVPQTVCEEFLQRIRETHEILRRQPGFVRDALLEQIYGPGRFNIVTMVEWESQAAIEAAREVVEASRAATGFNQRETMQRLGIEADMANYRHLEA